MITTAVTTSVAWPAGSINIVVVMPPGPDEPPAPMPAVREPPGPPPSLSSAA